MVYLVWWYYTDNDGVKQLRLVHVASSLERAEAYLADCLRSTFNLGYKSVEGGLPDLPVNWVFGEVSRHLRLVDEDGNEEEQWISAHPIDKLETTIG